jgi:iron complex outermembrane receptor protein
MSRPIRGSAKPLFALNLLASACVAAWAQTTPATELQRVEITGTAQTYQPPPTSTSTKTDTPILLTPQSVQVVPRAVLNDQKALTLTDAVRNVAGVSASTSASTAALSRC